MELLDAIHQRCSVRDFRDKPVEEDKLQRVLEAGRLAPSGNNRQAWKFVIVRDSKRRQQLAEAAEQPFLANSPVIVAVVGLDPQRVMSCGIPADPVDCAIAVSFMLLSAANEGLGTCWIGHFSQDEACKLLHVPPTARIVAMFPIGYGDQAAKAKSRKALREIVSYESF